MTKQTKRIRQRAGDQLVTVDVTTEPAVVDFDDIAAAVQILPDDCPRTPWDDCDGWEHTTERPSRLEGDTDEYRGHTWHAGDRHHVVVQLGPEASDGWGAYPSARLEGASRQVAAERVAAIRQQAIDQLCRWYANGWEYYGVTCDYLGAHDSCWGFLGYDFAQEQVEDIASNVAAQLEADGYTVEGKPGANEKRLTATVCDSCWYEHGPKMTLHKRSQTAQQWRDHYAREMNSQNWQGEVTRKRRR